MVEILETFKKNKRRLFVISIIVIILLGFFFGIVCKSYNILLIAIYLAMLIQAFYANDGTKDIEIIKRTQKEHSEKLNGWEKTLKDIPKNNENSLKLLDRLEEIIKSIYDLEKEIIVLLQTKKKNEITIKVGIKDKMNEVFHEIENFGACTLVNLEEESNKFKTFFNKLRQKNFKDIDREDVSGMKVVLNRIKISLEKLEKTRRITRNGRKK